MTQQDDQARSDEAERDVIGNWRLLIMMWERGDFQRVDVLIPFADLKTALAKLDETQERIQGLIVSLLEYQQRQDDLRQQLEAAKERVAELEREALGFQIEIAMWAKARGIELGKDLEVFRAENHKIIERVKQGQPVSGGGE